MERSEIHILVNPMLEFSKRLISKDGEKNNFNEYLKCFETVFPQSLTKLIEKHSSSPYPVKFLIYDSVLPWTLKVARKLGLDGAPFFTQSCAVNSIYCLYHQGRFEILPRGSSGVVSLPCTSMPLLGFDDLPWFVHDNISYQGVRDVIFNQFSNIEEPNWLFCNTFDELEYERFSLSDPIFPTIFRQ
ncbi:hypothetical protein LWI29_021984 [Acer saccharum]|uniref:Uncharacterized protein n=1 Tax=Acer saccharum TaxID=4024 RepID=A0AA39TNM5_ACESA|nr:hypothetical protein LWI29_021984 [Acer saccharum]